MADNIMLVILVCSVLFIGVAVIAGIVVGVKRSMPQNRVPNVSQRKQSLRQHILSEMAGNFRTLSWDIWDDSVHYADGQFSRIERAATGNITIAEYNPDTQIAKVCGESGAVYTTKPSECSCPYFQHRRLPCKHMYVLAMELEGDATKVI